ncbi:hypothetical protein PM082_024317 [Marasmius tenuissimus]|nr:hypothetical protein PM082_024317 [Marasmius tenuissimus]
MSSEPTAQSNPSPASANGAEKRLAPDELPQETLDFAAKIFDAARNGQEEPLIAAIEAGLPVNLTNHQGNTILMLAAYAGHYGLSKSLLSHGADPDRLNDQGQSIVAGAIFKEHHDIVKLLVDSKANVRLGKPNGIESVHMFGKDNPGEGKMSKEELLKLMGAKEEDKERLEREGVRVGPPVG